MKTFDLPFGEKISRTDILSKNSTIAVVYDADAADLEKYKEHLEGRNYSLKQSYDCGYHRFAAFYDGASGVFVNLFEGTKELYILFEENTRYFDFSDTPLTCCVKPSVTQIHLEDFGMSYALQLSDGRFILIDGGWEFEIDSDSLYSLLKKYSPYKKPVIAAWFLTHPHCDHFHAFLTFSSKYKDDTVIEKVIYNFPEKDDLAHFPNIAAEGAKIPMLGDAVSRVGAEIFTAHTGQIYKIGDASCKILASVDDILHKDTKSLNAASLVMRIELGGQVILFTADASCRASALAEKYGEYLRADILQIPHHGFGGGGTCREIAAYDLIKPSVCLLAVSDSDAYTWYCTYIDSTEYIMTNAGIDEMITGDQTRTLILPYAAPKYAKQKLERDFLSGRDDCGSRTWVFTELFTDLPDDCSFTVLNATSKNATVFIDVFFEDASKKLLYIKAEIPNSSIKKVRIFDTDSIDGDALYFNPSSLNKRGVPENAEFAVRFKSDVPVIISNKNKTAAYHSVNR